MRPIKEMTSQLKTRLTLKRVVIAYPSGNTTAVVFTMPQGINRSILNHQIMETWRRKYPSWPQIEQCCFVTEPQDPKAIARVEMFGGEFCGNAARSVVWLITGGKDRSGVIEVSGANRLINFSVKENEVTIEMSLPVDRELVTPINGGVLVQLDGISQIVVATRKGDQTARQLLGKLLNGNKYGLAGQSAVGVSYYDQISGKAEFCVWVNEVDTIFDETACGSGTSAIGIALATENGVSLSLPIVQPSGALIVTNATYTDGKVSKSTIAGAVEILYDGEFTLS